jgi:hypothetical protein
MSSKCSLCKGVGFVSSNIGNMRRCPACFDRPTPKETILYNIAEQAFKGNRMKNKQDTENNELCEGSKNRLEDMRIDDEENEGSSNHDAVKSISGKIKCMKTKDQLENLNKQLKDAEKNMDSTAIHVLRNRICGIQLQYKLKEIDERILKTGKSTKD